MSSSQVILLTRDRVLSEQVAGVAAACGAGVRVLSEASEVRREWTSASAVLVGGDSAEGLAALALPRRAGVLVVSGDAAVAAEWSVPLEALAVVLPAHSARLSEVLEAAGGGERAQGRWVRVVGGSGGVGTSTLAAALAHRLAIRGRRTALVELAAHGGGIDVLFGAESAPGWRWPELRSAAGQVGRLEGLLPNVSGVDLVSAGREWTGSDGGGADDRPGSKAVDAVLGSLLRTHDDVVVDGGWGERALQGCGRSLLLVGAGIRAVLAAQAKLRSLDCAEVSLVVRCGPGWRLDPAQVSAAMGLEHIGVIHHDRRLPVGLESGDPPGRGRGRFARDVDRLLARLSADLGDGSPRAAEAGVPVTLPRREVASPRWAA